MHVKDKILANDTNLIKFDYFYSLVYQIVCDACYKPILKVFFLRFKMKKDQLKLVLKDAVAVATSDAWSCRNR